MVKNILYKFMMIFLFFFIYIIWSTARIYIWIILCVADMSHVVSNDTASYTHCKIKNLKVTDQSLETDLKNLLT